MEIEISLAPLELIVISIVRDEKMNETQQDAGANFQKQKP